MHDPKYVLVSVDDINTLLPLLEHIDDSDDAHAIIKRLRQDTGGDFRDIARKLKSVRACPACVIEVQEQSCNYWPINKQGRRLQRLIDRADHIRSPGNHTS